MKHSKEPWQVHPLKLRWVANGERVVCEISGDPYAEAERIEACVNYCAGMSNEALTEDSAESVREDRDRLLYLMKEAAEHWLPAVRHDADEFGESQREFYARWDAAIANR